MRQRKASRVYESLARGEGFDADQNEVWSDVAESLNEAHCSSPTGALHDAYEARGEEISSLRQSFDLPDDAVGIAACREGRFAGLDLFDRASTLKYFWESLVDGYLIELLGGPSTSKRAGNVNNEAPLSLVADVMRQTADGEWEQFSSPGLGRDHRLHSATLTGTALVSDEHTILHLQLFPQNPKADGTSRSHIRGRIHRQYLSPPGDVDL